MRYMNSARVVDHDQSFTCNILHVLYVNFI